MEETKRAGRDRYMVGYRRVEDYGNVGQCLCTDVDALRQRNTGIQVKDKKGRMSVKKAKSNARNGQERKDTIEKTQTIGEGSIKWIGNVNVSFNNKCTKTKQEI